MVTPTMPTIFVAAGLLGLMAAVITALYNTLIALSRRCDQAKGDIDVQVKQRHDLVPNLVETVKGYAGHERGTLEAVSRARAAALAAPAGAAQLSAEASLGASIGRLLALAESYPELKASERFAALHAELADIENKIAAARRFFNSAVAEYNTTREQFPSNIVGAVFGFARRDAAIMTQENRAMIEATPAVRF